MKEEIKEFVVYEKLKVGQNIILRDIDYPDLVFTDTITSTFNDKCEDECFQVRTKRLDYDFTNFYELVTQTFKNWHIIHNQIDWVNSIRGDVRFSIGHKDLNNLDLNGCYYWMIYISKEEWVNKEDILSFNKAFVQYAALNNIKLDMNTLNLSELVQKKYM